MRTRVITKQEVEAEPYSVWNAYVDFLAKEHYDDLTPQQRAAHLVFWYMTQVENGGHLQYFENRGTDHLAETIDSLGLISATCQQQQLVEAGALWLSRGRLRIQTVEEYCEIALTGEFDAFDSRFSACSPTLVDCLDTYLARHQSAFVTLS